MRTTRLLALAITVLCVQAQQSDAANLWGLKAGNVQLKSAGPLAFGPDGILLASDPRAATVYAIATDGEGKPHAANVKDLGAAITEVAGKGATLVDLAVNPKNGQTYLSVQSGSAASILIVDENNEVIEVSLKNVAHSKIELPNAPKDKLIKRGRRSYNPREQSITDIAYIEGKVLVSGLSAAEAPSTVRSIPFPFTSADVGSNIVIYHGAHGKSENYSAVRAFVPFNINGKPNLLAGFTCTPLVKFPIDEFGKGEPVKGTTIAELGNRNRPYDVIVYKQGDQHFLLMANDRRGVMKISTENIERSEGINERVSGGGVAGQSYETIKELAGTVQLDKLSDTQAIVVFEREGKLSLTTVKLP